LRSYHQPLPEFILGFLCAIAIVAIAGLLFSMPDLGGLGSALWSPEAAGWAQALGTILALAGTYLIAGRQHRFTTKTANEDSLRRAKILAIFFTPFLKTIEVDVNELKDFCDKYKNIGVRNLGQIDLEQIRFRPISATEFLLSNAHHFPGSLCDSIPQLLAFRSVTDANLKAIVQRGKEVGLIDASLIRPIGDWLELMQKIVADIYGELPDLHDQSLKILLERANLDR
jgi:hypothetical protein